MPERMRRHPGFTLIELLVVIAVLALLIALLLPSLGMARTLARIAKAHAELRGVTIALAVYREDNAQQLPPTRFSCSNRTAYELPIELMGYLPRGRKNDVEIVKMPDPFHAEEGYKYRAVGPAIMNESTILPDAATLWVPDDFPYDGDDAQAGRYYNDPRTSPVRYAVWSMGPDPDSPKFDVPGRLPVPRKYWLKSAADTGVIVHLEDARGRIHTSP